MNDVRDPTRACQYRVIGQPISHSLSPTIHQMFAQELDINLNYEKAEVAPGELAQALEKFARFGVSGLNITLPLKEEAIGLASELTERARLAGAANTVVIKAAGDYLMDNTDGVGLIRDLSANWQVDLLDKDILILGAGGAVRGVIFPLLASRPRSIWIANRTLTKAQSLVALATDAGAGRNIDLTASDLQGLTQTKFDIVINGTSLGVSGQVPGINAAIFADTEFCYDMMYHKSGHTAFTRYANENGAPASADGLGMLVEQAAEAFKLWHGVLPSTLPVIQAIRDTR